VWRIKRKWHQAWQNGMASIGMKRAGGEMSDIIAAQRNMAAKIARKRAAKFNRVPSPPHKHGLP